MDRSTLHFGSLAMLLSWGLVMIRGPAWAEPPRKQPAEQSGPARGTETIHESPVRQVRGLVMDGRTSRAAAMLRQDLPRSEGAGVLLDGISFWVLHPDPEIAAAAVEALELIATGPDRAWEPDGSITRCLVRLGGLVDRNGPTELRVSGLLAMAAIAEHWSLTIDPGFLDGLSEDSEEEVRATALFLLGKEEEARK